MNSGYLIYKKVIPIVTLISLYLAHLLRGKIICHGFDSFYESAGCGGRDFNDSESNMIRPLQINSLFPVHRPHLFAAAFSILPFDYLPVFLAYSPGFASSRVKYKVRFCYSCSIKDKGKKLQKLLFYGATNTMQRSAGNRYQQPF